MHVDRAFESFAAMTPAIRSRSAGHRSHLTIGGDKITAFHIVLGVLVLLIAMDALAFR
jgi:hypothetical protein